MGLAVGAGVTLGHGGTLFSRNGVWPAGVAVAPEPGVAGDGAGVAAAAVGVGLSAKARFPGSHMAAPRPSEHEQQAQADDHRAAHEAVGGPHGTGSKPPGAHGWHRAMRRAPMTLPRRRP